MCIEMEYYCHSHHAALHMQITSCNFYQNTIPLGTCEEGYRHVKACMQGVTIFTINYKQLKCSHAVQMYISYLYCAWPMYIPVCIYI